MGTATELAERGWLPDAAVSLGIRGMLRRRLAGAAGDLASGAQRRFEESLDRAPLAVDTDAANAQHYEVPADYYRLVLGPRLKYSCALYAGGGETLAEAEEAMLALTCERAGLADGMRVLELGCGWGSLTLWMAERYPSARITAVSNSRSQREHIEARCRELGLANVTVLTRDINTFDPGGVFDRVVSVEMFEHLRNHAELFRRIGGWLAPGGRLFVHVFCHRVYCYPYTVRSDADWMAKHFFTGGMMPSYGRLPGLGVLPLEEQWEVNGAHYGKTLRDWLARHDARRGEVMPVMARTYGPAEAVRWFHRWRLFYLGCAGLFEHNGGREWFVAHYRFGRPQRGGIRTD